jgi:hypothetical protein
MNSGLWLALGILTLGPANGATAELNWSELAGAVKGKRVAIVLPDGVRVEGKVASVETDALSLEIGKSDDVVRYPKGRAWIPRASISTLEIRSRRGMWQAIGAGIGFGAGVPLCFFAITYANNEGGEAGGACAAALGGGAALGFALGSAAPGPKVIRVRP